MLIFLYYSGHPVFCSAVTIILPVFCFCFIFFCFYIVFILFIIELWGQGNLSLCIPLPMMNVTQCEGLSIHVDQLNDELNDH